MRKTIIMGAGGRDFHNFNVAFRDDPSTEVVAFTAAQVSGTDNRVYPAPLAGPAYPDGIPIRPEEELTDLIRRSHIDEVVLGYSDLAHETVMHKASTVLAAGADFRLMGPESTMLRSTRPVVALCAVRAGCGKGLITRTIGRHLLAAGLGVALVRPPTLQGELIRVQRFASIEHLDASHLTPDVRDEYEEPVRMGMVVYAGVDYEAILRWAEAEADVIIWEGGTNDRPFFVPELLVVVVDPAWPGHELRCHPGETNLRMANVVVVTRADAAEAHDIQRVLENIESVNPLARVIFGASRSELQPGPIRPVDFEFEEIGSPTLADVLEPIVMEAQTPHRPAVMTW